MSSSSSASLSQSAGQRVRYYRSQVVKHLPHPNRTWSWGEVRASHKLLCKLKASGVIEQTESGEWRTTRKLWAWIVEEAESNGVDTEQRSIDGSLAVEPGDDVFDVTVVKKPEDTDPRNVNPGGDTVQTILPTRCSEKYLGSEYTDQEETVLVVSTEADETEVVSNGAT